jgi:glutamate synthase (NADPH/NADH) small chain
VPTVFEKNDRIGGLLRYGIPDFKMDKALIDRRIAQMEAEGVIFRTGVEVGTAVTIERILDDYHLLVFAAGSEQPRDLPVAGRELGGVHFAMDFLVPANRAVAGLPLEGPPILATGRHVVVIGGGDTGSDCIGTANRQGAASVTQLEILPKPPAVADKALTWPYWPMKLRTSSSQEEGAVREFAVVTRRLVGESGRVTALECERADDRIELKADLVLLAMGFTGSPMSELLARAGIERNAGSGYGTSDPRIFCCGDMRRGQSLVVWAIREGRECAAAMDACLGPSSGSRLELRSASRIRP